MSRSKRVCFWLFVIVLVLGAGRGVHWWESRGQGFRLHKIQSSPPYDDRWDVSYTEHDLEQAKAALDQPYHYLGHGFQCYAFESKDKKYVLKFFRHQRLRLPKVIAAMPSFPFFDQWRKSRLLALSRREDHLLRSFKTAWDLARYENILQMVHLNVTETLFPTVEIEDLLGNRYLVELDKYQFLLQRKAELVKPTLSKFMDRGELAEAKKHVDSIFDLFVTCARKGILDTDGALIRKDNLGFFEGRAIYIDGGKLTPRHNLCTKKEFIKDLARLNPLRKWMEQNYPVLAEHFDVSKKRAIAAVVDMNKQKRQQQFQVAVASNS